PYYLTNVGGVLYFSASLDGVASNSLWRSDGTEAGTVMLREFNSVQAGPFMITNVGGTVFFVADHGVHGDELWKSNGTAASTVLVKDIVPGSYPSYSQHLTNVNGKLLFSANSGRNIFSQDLWVSDGTP